MAGEEEAITSHRHYLLALGIDVALVEIESSKGVKYNTHIVELCVSLFRAKAIRLPMRSGCYGRADR